MSKSSFGAGVESCALVCVLTPCDVASSKLESNGKLKAGFPMTGWKNSHEMEGASGALSWTKSHSLQGNPEPAPFQPIDYTLERAYVIVGLPGIQGFPLWIRWLGSCHSSVKHDEDESAAAVGTLLLP